MHIRNILAVVSLLIIGTSTHPLYESQNAKLNRKLANFDPLIAAASDDIPMVHNNNYDMIMPDYFDHHPAESMQYQNFEKFYDPQMADNTELNMDESQFLSHTPVRAPQPLSADERRIRQRLEPVDLVRERKEMKKLKKGTTKPRPGAYQWEQFDYDLYSVDPSTYQYKVKS